MSIRAPRILVFDSGVGGLSIAAAIRQKLPQASLLYLADNACFPYGDQPDEQVIARSVQLIPALLAQQSADMVVIGCNTASTLALPALREALSLPVVGVVPAIKPAAALSRNRRLGLLATPATVRRPYLDALVAEFAADCDLIRVGSSELVQLAEASLSCPEPDRAVLAAITAPFARAGVDTVVLGCTHFPLIRQALAGTLAPEVQWVDSGEAIARRIVSLMAMATDPAEAPTGTPGDRLYFTAAVPPGLEAWLSRESVREAAVVGDWRV
ncbi:MAG: glutamate racemase [Oleiphilaceae bacterium]|nr:glutamate racemase [Oleiphilaceae bacterium]